MLLPVALSSFLPASFPCLPAYLLTYVLTERAPEGTKREGDEECVYTIRKGRRGRGRRSQCARAGLAILGRYTFTSASRTFLIFCSVKHSAYSHDIRASRPLLLVVVVVLFLLLLLVAFSTLPSPSFPRDCRFP